MCVVSECVCSGISRGTLASSPHLLTCRMVLPGREERCAASYQCVLDCVCVCVCVCADGDHH